MAESLQNESRHTDPAQTELRRLNRALRMISSCNQSLVRAVSEAALLQDVCRIIVEQAGYRMAWVGIAEEDEAKVVSPVAWAGFDSGYLDSIQVSWGDNDLGRGPTGASIRGRQPCVMRSIASDPAFAPWREEAVSRGYLSSVALPLLIEERAFGALSIYAAEADAFNDAELEILQELAADLAFGIHTLRTRDAHQRADRELHLLRQQAQRALEESEQRFRALFENSPVPILKQDFTAVISLLESLGREGLEMKDYLRLHPEIVRQCAALVRITDVNRAAVIMHEASSKEELLQGLPQTFTPESYQVFADALVGLVQGQTNLVLDGVLRTLTGKIRHVNAFVSRVKYPTGVAGFASQPSTVLVSLVDITALKTSERRLRDANANLRLLLQTIPDLVWFKDPKGVFLLCNPPVERLVGAKEEDLLGKTDYDFYPAAKADLLRQKDQAAADAGKPCRYEQWIYSVAEGRQVLLETIKTAVRDHEGKLVGVLGIGRDISAVRKAEETLRKLSRAVEQSPTSIVITDLLGNIEYVNPKFCEVTGYTPAEVLGQNPRFLKSGETSDTNYQLMWETLSAGKEWLCEFHNRKKSGELYWELASISPIFDNDGRITHYVAVKENITERKRLEEEFRQAQKMEAFGQLAGGVAHDFNNILTVIQGNSALLQFGDLAPQDQAEAQAQISEAADRASRLTRQLLTFSRRQAVQRKELDLNAVVLNMTRMLQRLIGEHISLAAHYAAGGAVVQADEGMMEQVLMNLAVNSRDAMPAGGQLRIQTEVLLVAENPQQLPGTYVRLSVSDTGAGIAEEDLPHIFEPFFTTKDVGRGTGLGLATVFGIVQQHQGWVTVESQPGDGTTFRVHLPALDRSDGDGPEHRPVLLERGGTETILLVEDEPALRRMTCRVLERHGYRVYEAESGIAALKVWSEHGSKIALLLTDMVMPGSLGGGELGRRLQAESPALRVIYSSGYTDEMLGEASALRGKFNFLEKPYEVSQLLRKVRACLDAV